MEQTKQNEENTKNPIRSVLVWDLPTRLFHWLLVIFVIISFVTGNIGGNAMQYHAWGGFAILALLLFRLVWGFIGSRESRFVTFIQDPSAVIRYVGTFLHRDSPHYLGHNPLGGWSILALLFTLLVQAATGLFANDDIVTEGPLFDWVGKATSDWLTKVHKLNQQVIIALVCVHVAAVIFYFFYKRQNLILPMITGVKPWHDAEAEAASGRTWLAVIIAGLASLAVYFLVR